MSTLFIIAAVIALASQAKKKTQRSPQNKPKSKPKGPSQTAINEAKMEIDRIREMAGGNQETREELENNPIAQAGMGGLFDPIIPAGANTDGTTSHGYQKLKLLAGYNN